MASNQPIDLWKPFHFISLASDSSAQRPQFRINEQAVRALEKMRVPISVVGIVGLYRTGKSYVLNRLSGRQSGAGGFALGSTIEPCTRGIWACLVDPDAVRREFPGVDLPGIQTSVCLLLDTEGLGSYAADRTHDASVFALAIRLSSLLVYNSVGSIDEGALEKLGLVVELTRQLSTKDKANAGGSGGKNNLIDALDSPRFIWLLRDFSLKLETSDGRKITPAEYLEHALQVVPEPRAALAAGGASASSSKNQTRASISRAFPNRGCHALRRPVRDEADLQALGRGDRQIEQALRPEFLTDVDAFIRDVYRELPVVRARGVPMNGQMYIDYVEAVVKSINAGALPVLSSTYASVLSSQKARMCEALLQEFDRQVAHLSAPVPAGTPPVQMDDFDQLLSRARSAFAHISIMYAGDLAETASLPGDFALPAGSEASDLIGWRAFERELLNRRQNFERALTDASRTVCIRLAEELLDDFRDECDSLDSWDLFSAAADELLSKYDRAAIGPARHLPHRMLMRSIVDSGSALAAALAREERQTLERSFQAELDHATTRARRLETEAEHSQKTVDRARAEATRLNNENIALMKSLEKVADALTDMR